MSKGKIWITTADALGADLAAFDALICSSRAELCYPWRDVASSSSSPVEFLLGCWIGCWAGVDAILGSYFL